MDYYNWAFAKSSHEINRSRRFLYPASCNLHRPPFIVNRPFSTFKRSNAPTFHPSTPFKTAKKITKLGVAQLGGKVV
jgi:hypothetical protein